MFEIQVVWEISNTGTKFILSRDFNGGMGNFRNGYFSFPGLVFP